MDVLKSLHTSVAQTFEKAFDDAYRDLNAEITPRDRKVEEAEKKAKCAEEARDKFAAEVQELKHEIAILHEELARSDVNAEGVQVSADQVSKLKETFSPQHTLIFGDSGNPGLDSKNAIVKKYAALYNEFMTLIKATDGLRLQIKRHKRKLTYWRECLDRDKFTLVLDGIPVQFERTQRTMSGSRTQKPTTSHEAKLLSRVDEGSGSKLHLKPPSPQPDGHRGTSSSNPQHELPNKSLLLCEPVEVPTSDSTLPASRNEVNSPKPSSQADNLQEPPVWKEGCLESCKSSPGVLPRDDSAMDSKTQGSTLSKGGQMPSSLVRESSHRVKSHQMEESNNGDPSKEREYNIGLRHEATPPTVLPLSLDTAGGNSRASTAGQGSSRYTGGYLPRASPKRDHGKDPERSLKHALSLIAEDGDESNRKRHMRNSPRNPLSEVKCSQLPSSQGAARTERRLHKLLESPLPPRHSLRPHKGIQAEVDEESDDQHEELGFTKPVDVEISSNRQSTPAQNKGTRLPSELASHANDCEPNGMHPGDEPYRVRPLHRLDLSHFKINPNYNHGLDFAYDDVVRRRHERESIQGCTRPDCCGQKFLAMARLGGLPTHLGKSSNEDREILEDFLGEDKGIIDRMTAAEYQRILHEAKARLMANQYGRHRHHHQRPSTPPGFWRTDMPDTQEMECDHEEALQMEREKVKERYRQAMRPGGLWKFADE